MIGCIKRILNKIRCMPDGIKASVAFFGASVVTSGISYLVTPIYTRLLPPEVYGQTTVYMTWVQIFGILAMFCLSYGVFNNGMIDYSDQRDEYAFSMLILSNVITIVFIIILCCVFPFVKNIINVDAWLMLLMCVSFLVQPAYSFWTARQRYEYKYKFTVIWTIICSISSPAFAVLCVMGSENKLYGRLFGAEIPLILIYIGFYIYVAKKSQFRVNLSYWKGALAFNIPLIPHYLSSYLLGNINRLLISNIEGDRETAYYSVAYSVASVALIVWSAVNASLVPYTYENCKKKNYQAIAKITESILIFFALICIAVIMFAPEVVAFMATQEYMEAIYVIPPIVGGVFFQIQYYIYANVIYYYKKTQYVMFASVISVVANWGLGYVAISKWGYLAAGYITLICFLLQACLDYYAMRKVVKDNIYNMKFMGWISGIVISTIILCNFIYDYMFVRYSIVCFVILVCFIKKDKIINIVTEIRR